MTLVHDKVCNLMEDPWKILSVPGIRGIMCMDFSRLLGHCINNMSENSGEGKCCVSTGSGMDSGARGLRMNQQYNVTFLKSPMDSTHRRLRVRLPHGTGWAPQLSVSVHHHMVD